MIKAFIFDFDGVIVESLKIKSDAFYEIYQRFGLEVAKKVVDHHESNGGMSRFKKFKIYHNEFLGKAILDDEILELSKIFSNLVVQKVASANYVKGVIDFLQNISENNFKIFISTATPQIEINNILNLREINHFFDDVFGSPSEKTNHLLKIIDTYDFKASEMIFFGDSKSDMLAAQNVNTNFVLRLHELNNKKDFNYFIKSINNFENLSLMNLLERC
tara:strand:- start:3489 stop:4142 length:654 start_codon:yes stop_codon:yes gene_type:complete